MDRSRQIKTVHVILPVPQPVADALRSKVAERGIPTRRLREPIGTAL